MKLSDYTPEQIAKIKRACQTDLFYLGKEVLGKDFVEGTHRAMCDFYVKKDPTLRFKEFGKTFTGSHDRLQLVPRLTYKSTIKVLDDVQWILNYPEVRTLTITAAQNLAVAFIDELTMYFTVRGKTERNPATNLVEGGNPNFFQQLFPQHCITEEEGVGGEYITPARKQLPPGLWTKDPTAGSLSMGSTTSGWRCDIVNFDDGVSDRNAETGNQLIALSDRIAMISELLVPEGFRHTVATRYNPLDPYGKLAESHGITELYGDFERDGLKYMCRPCWWKKGEPYAQPDYKLGCPQESELDLFFPESSTFSVLRKKFKNPKTFFSQQLNAPQEAAELPFAREMVRSCIVDHTALPTSGTSFIAWDHAWSTKNARDYSVGAVGLFDVQGRLWITDVLRGRWDFTEKCYQVVNAIRIHHPSRTCIEDSNGAQGSMTPTLDREAKTYDVELKIDWIGLGRGTADSKYLRMSTLHPWMSQKRMFFLNTIPCIDDLVNEFCNIGIERQRNDIPDAISRLVEQYSRTVASTVTREDDAFRWKQMEEREFRNLMFNRGQYSPGSDWDNGWTPQQQPTRGVDPMTLLPSSYDPENF